jgi:hypothetical protein
MQITIPCSTYVRHAEFVLGGENWRKTIRYENGMLISVNRHGHIMAVEKIDGPEGAVQLLSDQTVIDICKSQMVYNADLVIDVMPEAQWASGYTTHGEIMPDNMSVWSADGENQCSKWREVIMKVRKPPNEVDHGMFWWRQTLIDLAIIAPTGDLMFEKVLGVGGRPTIVADDGDPNWFAVLQPWKLPEHPMPPQLPDWLK